MAILLFECAVRASVIAAGGAIVLWAMQIKRATTRHAAWTTVVIAMLLLPIWSAAGPKLALRLLQPAEATTGTTPDVPSLDSTSPFRERLAPVQVDQSSHSGSRRRLDAEDALLAVYALGVFVFLVRLSVGTIQANNLRASARLEAGRATSARCVTPITVGWLTPVLILPRGWRRWPAAQLNAVLTHEAQHARRRDPLVQWFGLLNRAIFWFHPLAWWLEGRLAALAEEACDAAVLAAGHSPQSYSAYLLEMVGSVAREGGRVRAVGMAMPGSGLQFRLRQILDGMPQQSVSRARVICTLVLCATAAALGASATPVAQEQKPASTAAQKFEVVSVKTCESVPEIPGGRIGGGGRLESSPGTINVTCMTVADMIRRAYVQDGTPPPLNSTGVSDADLIKGGPAWARTAKYSIEAKAEGAATLTTMAGPMLRALLEDRFHLKLYAEVTDVPALALTVAPGGLKMKPIDPASCTLPDPDHPGPRIIGDDGLVRAAKGEKPLCVGGFSRNGANSVYKATGQSLDHVAKTFSSLLFTRPVVDKTGTAGQFSFSVEFAPDDTMRPVLVPRGETPGVADGPTLFSALEKLGLKLVPAKAPRGFLMIDRVERPSPDGPGALTGAGGR